MHTVTAGALAACLLLAALPAPAANLLANPDFDVDAGGWALSEPAEVTHVADDGVPPGALRFENQDCCTIQAAQCLAVDGGVRYDMGGFFRQGPVAEGSLGDGIGMDVQWFEDAACSVYPALGIHYWSWTDPVGEAWTLRVDTDLAAPATAQGALVRIRQYNFAGLPGFVSLADAVFFQRAPGIFADGFE